MLKAFDYLLQILDFNKWYNKR